MTIVSDFLTLLGIFFIVFVVLVFSFSIIVWDLDFILTAIMQYKMNILRGILVISIIASLASHFSKK